MRCIMNINHSYYLYKGTDLIKIDVLSKTGVKIFINSVSIGIIWTKLHRIDNSLKRLLQSTFISFPMTLYTSLEEINEVRPLS